MCQKGNWVQICNGYEVWLLISVSTRLPVGIRRNMGPPCKAQSPHLSDYLRSDCFHFLFSFLLEYFIQFFYMYIQRLGHFSHLLPFSCIVCLLLTYNQGFVYNPLKFAVFLWLAWKKKHKNYASGYIFL
jgi:hypothetical protein